MKIDDKLDFHIFDQLCLDIHFLNHVIAIQLQLTVSYQYHITVSYQYHITVSYQVAEGALRVYPLNFKSFVFVPVSRQYIVS